MSTALGRAAVAWVLCWLLFAAVPVSASRQLGDGHTRTKRPERGVFLACKGSGDPAVGVARPWVSKRAWRPAARPTVPGSVSWPGAKFELTPRGGGFSFAGNGLPVAGATGAFPAGASSAVAQYPETQRAVAPHAVSGTIPAPARPGRARCVSGGVVGVALNGIPLLAPSDRNGRDLVAREVTDACGGAVGGTGAYGHRQASACLGSASSGHSAPIGYALDGFLISGPRGLGGHEVRNRELDRCHGHVHKVNLGDGRTARRYHYHASASFPYLVGCFRAKPGSIAGAPLSQEPRTRVSTNPALYPAFDPAVSDYVTRCNNSPVAVSVVTAAGESVSIDGSASAAGEVTRQIPVAGGQAFAFTLSASGSERTYHVRCLPADFPDWTFERVSRPSQDYVLVTPLQFPSWPPYVIAFDREGVPVWWYRSAVPPIDARLLSDGSFAFARFYGGFASDPRGAYEIRRLDGSLVRTAMTVGSPTDHHELIETGNGTLLALTYRARDGVDLSPYGGPAAATIVDSEIQELAPDGSVTWSWSSKDHISLDETGRWWPSVLASPTTLPDGRTAYDPTHINSIEVDGSSLVLSMRHTDSLYAIDRSTGAIEWKLGGTARPERLAVAGDPHGGYPFGGQHDARVLGDGTITVHDNATGLGGRPPRAVRYAIDEAAGSATLLESLGDPAVGASFCCGSARRLPGGTWLLSWGGTPFITELGPAGRVFSLQIGTSFSYRAFPVAPGRVSAASLRQGMDAMYPRP